jgi:DNA (cytosine-5)-methyltransferase 1
MIPDTKYELPIKVFDFFVGCGGATKGFEDANLESVFAIDNNIHASKTFSLNFPETKFYNTPKFENPISKTTFLLSNIEDVPIKSIEPIINNCKGSPILFAGCAPCQPFSQQKTKHQDKDPRKGLLEYFRQFVEYYQPEFIFVENVPGIQKVQIEDGGPFDSFIKTLNQLGYYFDCGVLQAQNYGVPQKRRRFILIASKLGEIKLPPATHGSGKNLLKYSTPREWMGDLPPIIAGETHSSIPNHQAAKLTKINLDRISATPEGGDRMNWPQELKLVCHTNGYTGHTDVYGRIKWDELSSCLTTKCTSISNGRFGHPQQNRAISAREAACLQTFPRDFVFDGGVHVAGRQIGNAVPVLLAKRFGEHFNNHINKYLHGE